MRRLPRIHGLRPLGATPSPAAAATAPLTATSAPTILTRRHLSTTRPAPFHSTRRLASSAEDKKRQEMLEAMERDRQSAVELQAQYEAAALEAEQAAAEAGEEDLLANSRIPVPPEFSYAPAPKDAPSYTPAQTAEGLEEVGGLEGWWDQEGHWGEADGVRVFGGRGEGNKITDKGVLEVLIRQAVVEGLVARAKGGEQALWHKWVNTDKSCTARASAVELSVTKDGDITLNGDLAAVLTHLRRTRPESNTDLTAEEVQKFTKTWSPTWQHAPINDPNLKFAISKRIYQLTGHRIPDAKLAPVKTAGDLYTTVARPPKARRLGEEIERRRELLELPNVKVYGRRVTPIDKQVWMGRWKVIEDELRKRDLPITGTGKYGKAKEKGWLMGRP